MKKLVIISLLLALSSIGISQNSLENKLLEVFSTEQTNVILGDAQQNKYYNNLVFNSFRLKKVAASKVRKQNFVILSSIELRNTDGTSTSITAQETVESINNGTFNILKTSLERDFNDTKVYLLGNTNHILSISSHKTLSKLQKQ